MKLAKSILISFSNSHAAQGSTKARPVALLFTISLAIRIVVLFLVPDAHLSTNATIAYLGGAHTLVEGKGFRDPSYPIFTPPLYAIIIALGIVTFGSDQLPIKIVQLIADSLTVVVLYFIVLKIFNVRTAVLASVLWALYPFAIYPTVYIGTETLFAFLLSVFVLLSISAIESERLNLFVSAGAVLGFCTLMRGTTQFIPLVFPLFLLMKGKLSMRCVVNWLALCFTFVLVIAPWTLRNHVVLDSWIPVAAASNVFLWGSTEKFLTIDERDRELPGYFKSIEAQGMSKPGRSSSFAEKDRFLLAAGIHNYKSLWKSGPSNFVTYLTKKFFRLWYSTESGTNHGIILSINALFYLFGIAGILLAWIQRMRPAYVLACLLVYFIILHSASLPLFRYMVPVMPYIMAFAAFAIVTLQSELSKKVRRSFVISS